MLLLTIVDRGEINIVYLIVCVEHIMWLITKHLTKKNNLNALNKITIDGSISVKINLDTR